MPRRRPSRLKDVRGIGVDQMGNVGDDAATDNDSQPLLRLENLDINVPPDPIVAEATTSSSNTDEDNSYLPFIGKKYLRNAASAHVSSMTGDVVQYSGEKNCIISAGGLSGILNVLLATVENGDGVVMTDPTYAGLINRVYVAGGIPKFVPFQFNSGGTWKLDLSALKQIVDDPKSNITTMLMMSPSMPSGGFIDAEDWSAVADLCVKHDLLLILDTAMERLVFDNRRIIHPASLPGMAQRTVTVGSASKELRMIGWRVGWVVAPEELIPDIAAASMANVVVPVGIAQKAAALALEKSKSTISTWAAELQARRDIILQELRGLPVGVPAGGLSLLLDVSSFGLTGAEASKKLLDEGICVTAMTGWGVKHGSQYVRLVFSNESVERLKGLGIKFRKALGVK